MVGRCFREFFALSSLLQLIVVIGYDNRSIFSSAMSVASASTSSTCAVVGVGVLGTSLCKQLLHDPDLKDLKGTQFVAYNLGIVPTEIYGRKIVEIHTAGFTNTQNSNTVFIPRAPILQLPESQKAPSDMTTY